MDGIAYGAARASSRPAGKTAEPVRRRQGWFMRLIGALSESRRLQAEREIRRHAHLIPSPSDHDDRA